MAKRLVPRIANPKQSSYSQNVPRGAFGENEAAALDQNAKVLQGFGEQLEGMYIESEKSNGTKEAIAANEANFAKAAEIQRTDPTNAFELTQKALSETKLEFAGKLKSTYSQETFDTSFERSAASLRRNAIVNQEKAVHSQSVAVTTESVNQNYSTIINSPSDRQKVSVYIKEDTGKLLRLNGVEEGSELWDMEMGKVDERVSASAISGYVLMGDTDSADKLLKENKNSLDPELYQKLQNDIDKKQTTILSEALGAESAKMWHHKDTESFNENVDLVYANDKLTKVQKDTVVSSMRSRRKLAQIQMGEQRASKILTSKEKYLDGEKDALDWLTPEEKRTITTGLENVIKSTLPDYDSNESRATEQSVMDYLNSKEFHKIPVEEKSDKLQQYINTLAANGSRMSHKSMINTSKSLMKNIKQEPTEDFTKKSKGMWDEFMGKDTKAPYKKMLFANEYGRLPKEMSINDKREVMSKFAIELGDSKFEFETVGWSEIGDHTIEELLNEGEIIDFNDSKYKSGVIANIGSRKITKDEIVKLAEKRMFAFQSSGEPFTYDRGSEAFERVMTAVFLEELGVTRARTSEYLRNN